MLQPVTKVILTRKPQLQVEEESLVEQLEVNPEENVKKKCQKSKFRLFPLAVTSIANHENIRGDNSPPLQHNWLSPSVPLQNHPALVKTCFRDSLNKAQSNLISQRNFKKSSEKSLIFKAKLEQEARTKNGGHSKKNMKIHILKEKLLVEEQTNSAPKRKKLEYFSNSLNSENLENLKNRNILLLPHLSKNGSPNHRQFSSTADYLLKSFVEEADNKTKSRFLPGEPEEELKKMNGWKHLENNQSEYSNSLPKIKNLPKNSVWNYFNGTAHYPHRRNLLLDWYTYDICYPVTFKSWPSLKDKNDIEIVGTQVLSQGSPRNPNEQPFIFTPEINETPNKMLQNFNSVNFRHCLNESRYKASSSSNQICSGHNGSFSQNQLSHNAFLQETDSCLLWPKKIRKLSKRVTKSKQLSPIQNNSIMAKLNLKENGEKLSVWNHFTQQKPIQLQMSVLKQFKAVNNGTATMQNNRNLNLNIQSEFKENQTEKNLLYQTPTKMAENMSWKRTLLPMDRTVYSAFLQPESDKQ